jgi:hypothetical protein
VIALVALIVLVAVAVMAAGRLYLRTRGTRVVHCPATKTVAAVQLSPLPHARRIQIRGCSLWPRAECRQSCRTEIERSWDGCAYDAILSDWFRRKDCARCARPIVRPRPGLRPALLSPQGRIVRWSELRPASVFDAMATHRPVCARCAEADRGGATHHESPALLHPGHGRPPSA